MTPERHIKVVIALVAVSVMVEVNVLAGLATLGEAAYHGWHLVLMAAVLVAQLALHRSTPASVEQRRYALWFAAGLGCTMVGDFVNSAISGVEPVTRKLSVALVLFGAGYGLYCAALWHHHRAHLSAHPVERPSRRYLVLLLIAALNVATWFAQVRGTVEVSDVLTYGSFAFNVTIYVALPAFALWYAVNTRWSIGGLVVLVGAILIPYSDLVLFRSWLADGNPDVPSQDLYAANWILYFSGQCLMSLFPALVLVAARSAAPKQSAAMRPSTSA